MLEAYHKIFKRCGLKYYQVDSDPGMMGGAIAHEFMAPSPAGEDTIILCDKCGYAANTELAVSTPESQPPVSGDWKREDVETPEKRTVAEVSNFLKYDSAYFIKSLLLIGKEGPFMALIRGDQELHEKKLEKIAGAFRPADRDEVKETLGVEAGFIGPHNNKLKKFADESLREGIYISGANREGYHTRGIRSGIDFEAEWHDIHVARQGEGCTNCGATVGEEKVIEIGNIFKLGIKYSKPLKAVYLDEEGREVPITMGSYGIGPARIAAAAVEQNHDRNGIMWPPSIAPFDAEIIPLSRDDDSISATAEKIYQDLEDAGFDVIVDDRDERPGVKFKDADLIGIPYQIIIGKKALKEGLVEMKNRSTSDVQKLAPAEVVRKMREAFKPVETGP
jgi:prolyl-tRNA synthetase